MGRWFLNFSFGGRARRSHVWANWLAWLVAGGMVLGVGMGMISAAASSNGGQPGAAIFPIILMMAAVIATSFIDHLAMTWRRAHDTGRTGWVWILLFIPLINLLPIYWLLVEDSQQGPNKYGPPVKSFYVPPPITEAV